MTGTVTQVICLICLMTLLHSAVSHLSQAELEKAENEVQAKLIKRGEEAKKGPKLNSKNPHRSVIAQSRANSEALDLDIEAEVQAQVIKNRGLKSKADVEKLIAKKHRLDCRYDRNVWCDVKSEYRTIDGTCNNLGRGPSDRKRWYGSANTPMERLHKPDYADGSGSPRVASNGNDLPNARTISNLVFKQKKEKPSPAMSLLHMTFGQFLDHDIGHIGITQISANGTANGELLDVSCGSDGCSTVGEENVACMPIAIISKTDVLRQLAPCITFVRASAAPALDCILSSRQQLNQITSYLDASHIYGSDPEHSEELRDMSDPKRGKMLVTSQIGRKPLLPQDKSPSACPFASAPKYCFKAGDDRANEQNGLTCMHTVWVREHNRIAEQLHTINPGWSGETLYQETRRIVGAIWQRIVYNEWLHLVIGPDLMTSSQLNVLESGYSQDYNASVNAAAINAFQTAAMRFGHSEIAALLKLAGADFSTIKDEPLTSTFFNTKNLYDTFDTTAGVDAVLLGQISVPAETSDYFLTEAVRDRLFTGTPPNGPGTDLAALNVQRGRDHGLPGYTAWRKLCGLSVPASIDDMADIPNDVRKELKKHYTAVEDVDLYAGGLAEYNVPGGRVGPTFACIIAKQFKCLKTGDRFWHETDAKYVKFTPDQLTEIRKMSMARVLCNNLDGMTNVQKYVLLKPRSEAIGAGLSQTEADMLYGPGENNARVPCANIPAMDLTKW